jgi:hypothetical protein
MRRIRGLRGSRSAQIGLVRKIEYAPIALILEYQKSVNRGILNLVAEFMGALAVARHPVRSRCEVCRSTDFWYPSMRAIGIPHIACNPIDYQSSVPHSAGVQLSKKVARQYKL